MDKKFRTYITVLGFPLPSKLLETSYITHPNVSFLICNLRLIIIPLPPSRVGEWNKLEVSVLKITKCSTNIKVIITL